MNDEGLLTTWDVLKTLQFRPDAEVVSDVNPGLSYHFGDFKLCVSQCTNQQFCKVILFTCCIVTKRTMAEINFEMPLQIQLPEICAAWITWHLDKAEEIPANLAPWLDLGRQNRHLLPWEIERERLLKAYENRLHCSIHRDWLKLALRSLAAILAECTDNERVNVSFDGRILTINCAGKHVIVGAEGSAWPGVFTISASNLRPLPKRLMSEHVEVSIMCDNLDIDRRRYSGVLPQ
jgi:hypothetical protein